MSFSKRGVRLVKALEKMSVDKPTYFDTINIFNKMKFTDANEDNLRATMVVDHTMCNAYDIMHGGYLATIVDVMCLYARVAKTQGKMGLTVNLYINFLNSATVGEKIIAEAKSINGGNGSIMETLLYKENGILIAKGTASFKNGTEENQMEAINKIGFDVLKSDEIDNN